MRRPLDPRRLARPLRWLVLIGVVAMLASAFRGVRLVPLPDGPAIALSVMPGKRVIARAYDADHPPARDDVCIYLDREGAPRYGVLAAFAGDPVEVDTARGRVRRVGGDWLPVPDRVFDHLPLQEGDVLVLSDNNVARDAGRVVRIDRLVARVITSLPW